MAQSSNDNQKYPHKWTFRSTVEIQAQVRADATRKRLTQEEWLNRAIEKSLPKERR